jgi:hypothetical protein
VQALRDHPSAGLKQASQEQLAVEKEGVTYNQIRLVITLKQQGMPWNDHIVQNPAVPAAHSPLEGQQPEDDDDIPF